MGPLSGKQQREFIALSMKEKREQEKLQREEARKDQLHAVKLSGEAAKVQQSLIQKDDTHSAKMEELGGKATEAAPKVVGPLLAASGSENVKGVFQPKGTDTVPAMLTPGEAIIPKESAQDPANKPIIESLVAQGRNRKQNVVAMMDTTNGYLSNGTSSVEQKGTVPTSTMSKAPVGWGLVEAALKALKGSNTRIDDAEKKAVGYADGSTSVPPMGSGLLEGARKAITTRKDRLQEEEDKAMGTKYYEEGTVIVSPEEVVPPMESQVQAVPVQIPMQQSMLGSIPQKAPSLPNQPEKAVEVPKEYNPAVSPDYYRRLKKAESNNDPNVVNPLKGSTASGWYQVVGDTYKGLQKNYPDKFGSVAFQSKEFFDPKFQNEMAGYLTHEVTSDMRKSGIPINDATAYGGHVLGAPTAKKVFKSPDETPIAYMVSEEKRRANKWPDDMTVGGLKQWFANRIGADQSVPEVDARGKRLNQEMNHGVWTPKDPYEGQKALAPKTIVPTIENTLPKSGEKIPSMLDDLPKLAETTPPKGSDPVLWKEESYGSQDAINKAVAAWNATPPAAGEKKSELGLAGTLKEIFSGFKSLSGLNEQDLTRFAMNYAGSVISGRKPGRALRYAGKTAMDESMNRIIREDKQAQQDKIQQEAIAGRTAAARIRAGEKVDGVYKDLVNNAYKTGALSEEHYQTARKLVASGNYLKADEMLNDPRYGTPERLAGISSDAKPVHVMQEGYLRPMSAYEDPKNPGHYLIPQKDSAGRTTFKSTLADKGSNYSQVSPDSVAGLDQKALDNLVTKDHFTFNKEGKRTFDKSKEAFDAEIMEWSSNKRKLGLPDDPRKYATALNQALDLAARSGEKKPNATKILDMLTIHTASITDESKINGKDGKPLKTSQLGDASATVINAFKEGKAPEKFKTPSEFMTNASTTFEANRDKLEKAGPAGLAKEIPRTNPYRNKIEDAPNTWWAYVYYNLAKAHKEK